MKPIHSLHKSVSSLELHNTSHQGHILCRNFTLLKKKMAPTMFLFYFTMTTVHQQLIPAMWRWWWQWRGRTRFLSQKKTVMEPDQKILMNWWSLSYTALLFSSRLTVPGLHGILNEHMQRFILYFEYKGMPSHVHSASGLVDWLFFFFFSFSLPLLFLHVSPLSKMAATVLLQ